MFGSTYTNLFIPVLLFLLRLAKKRVVVTIHGVIPRSLFDSGKITRILPNGVPNKPSLLRLFMFCMYGALSKLSSKIIVHSQIFKQWLVHYLINPNKIIVIRHGIETNRNADVSSTWANLEGRIILNFGVITPRKGLETLILAFSKLNTPDIVLVIAGREMPYYEGYAEKIKQLARECGVENKVVFAGFLSDKELHYIFEKAEFVVLPYSVSISASGALAIAIQHCKPTIVTETEFFMEELAMDEAIFVPIDNVEELKLAMETLMQSKELRNYLSEALEKKLGRNSWENVAKQTLEVYH